MKEVNKRRLSQREQQRLQTLRANKSQAAIVADARRAGRLSPTKIDSEKAKKLIELRWEKFYAANPDKLQARIEREKREREKRIERARERMEREKRA